MFNEQIAKWTADHLRTHIEDYLTEVNAWFDSPATLVVPKSIEPASVVGGLFTEYDEILPQYGIDIPSKVEFEAGPDLMIYQYSGQINGMLHTTSRASADTLIKRHEAAVELFIRRHQFTHTGTASGTNDPNFTLLEMLFSTVDFSGAEDLGEVKGRQTWLNAFSIDLFWWASEDGSSQHG